MSILGTLIGAAGTAVLQRTFIMKNQGSSFFGIPQPLAVFDAVLEENPEYTADVTQHPVEEGTEVTDHIQLKNPTLSLKGTISNSPLDLSVSVANVASAGIDLITSSQARSNLLNTGLQQAAGNAGAALMGGNTNPLGGAADAIARTILLTAFETKSIVDVVTKRQTFGSMAIQSLRFPRDQNTGHQLVFEIEFIKVRIVSPLSISLKNLAENVLTGSAKSNLGNQVGGAVSTQTASAAGGSWLRKGFTAVAGG